MIPLGGSVVVTVLHIDVISGVICPWCYIGKRRLEKAIASFGGPVTVRRLPFQLNPAMPREGVSRREYRTGKFGSRERSQELDARVVAAGQSEGIRFAFDRIERTPNTLDAHRLIGLAERQGVQGAVVEALFRAYFTEGRDISGRRTQLDVGAGAGRDRHESEALLTGDDGLEATKDGDAMARRFLAEGVPFFIVNGTLTLVGARQPDAFLEALRQAATSSDSRAEPYRPST
jgi:predicted DsbA family dithiol-disulfide isomerase